MRSVLFKTRQLTSVISKVNIQVKSDPNIGGIALANGATIVGVYHQIEGRHHVSDDTAPEAVRRIK